MNFSNVDLTLIIYIVLIITYNIRFKSFKIYNIFVKIYYKVYYN